MIIQKQVVRETANRAYYRFAINLSTHDMHQLGWKAGTKLKTSVRDGQMVLEKVK